MGVPVGQRKHLDRIESSLRATDPQLASLFTIFTQLNRDEEMPAVEQLRAGAQQLRLWLSFRRTTTRRWLRTIPGARLRTALFFPVALAVMACTMLLGGMPGSHRCSSVPHIVDISQLNPKTKTMPRACSPVLWSRGLTASSSRPASAGAK